MTQFKHCFIIENGTYREISYTTLYLGTKRNPEYADRYFLPFHGCLMEVSYEDYRKEYQLRRRWKYIHEEARLNGEVSYHALVSEDRSGEEIIRDLYTNVENEAITHIMCALLRKALKELTEVEMDLIDNLYFKGLPEREYAAALGISQKGVNKRRHKVLVKLKRLIEKI